jgi:Tfp pilus assembly protein PilF
MPLARTAALKALEIDDASAEAHLSLGVVAYAYDWDFAAAERCYARALDLNPNDSEVHHFYGWYLFAIGRCDKAVTVLRRAQELDPLHVNAHVNLAVVFYLAHDFEAAIAECEAAIELEPNWFWSHQLMGLVYQRQGKSDQAVSEIKRARELNDAPAVLASLAHVLAAVGRRAEALETLARLEAIAGRMFVEPYEIATVHAGLGDLDATLRWLDRAYQERSCMMAAWFKMDPRFDRLREDPRFHTLISRIGFPP